MKVFAAWLAVSFALVAGCQQSQPKASVANAQPKVHNATSTLGAGIEIPLPSGFAYPNGIASTADGTLFVGSVTAGTLLRIAPGQAPQVLLENDDQLFAGTALKFDPKTNLLWVSSPDFLGKEVDGEMVRRPHRIAVVDTEQAKVVWSTEVPKGGFVNDIALDGKGGVFLTDSTLDQVWHLDGPGADFAVHARSPLFAPGALGPAGIARLADESLIISLYDDGALLRIAASGEVTPIATQRPLQNPDGLALTPGGWLLVVEGAVDSGAGRLSAIDMTTKMPHPVIVLAEGLDTPVNLLVTGNEVVVSESRIRHRMRPKKQLSAPSQWRLMRYALPLGHGKPETEVAAQLPTDFFPESIAIDAKGRFYVGSATRSEILRISRSGVVESWIGANTKGLMSVQGLLVDTASNQLYVCTADLKKHSTPTTASALLAFTLDTGTQSGRWPLDAEGFCNDITALPGGSMLISDTFRGRLWNFDPEGNGTLNVWMDDAALRGVNGIAVAPANDRVIVSTFSDGRLLSVGLNPDGSARELSELKTSRPLDGGDAVRITSDGRLLLFENGLVGGKGRVTLGVIDGKTVRLSTIEESPVGPVSGVIDGNSIVWPASNFARLFADNKDIAYGQSLYRTPIPGASPSTKAR